MHDARRRGATAILLLVLASASAAQAPSEETVDYFRLNCANCHTIGGGRLIGPDLKGVTERRQREWLLTFVADPKGAMDRGDPDALKLLQEASGQLMTVPPTISRDRIEKLLDLIAAESALEKSQFVGLQLDDRALTDLDVRRGRALFLGEASFQNGAPACVSCHTVAGLGGLGGGRLGLDLTAAFGRLQGRKALGAWLAAPPSPTMQPVFKRRPLEGEEILALVAFLKAADDTGQEVAASHALPLLLLGAALAALILVAFDFLWRHRFRAVRQPLVEHAR